MKRIVSDIESIVGTKMCTLILEFVDSIVVSSYERLSIANDSPLVGLSLFFAIPLLPVYSLVTLQIYRSLGIVKTGM